MQFLHGLKPVQLGIDSAEALLWLPLDANKGIVKCRKRSLSGAVTIESGSGN